MRFCRDTLIQIVLVSIIVGVIVVMRYQQNKQMKSYNGAESYNDSEMYDNVMQYLSDVTCPYDNSATLVDKISNAQISSYLDTIST